MSLQLASLFRNHAVLQRDRMLPVWGWATPGTTMRIVLGPHLAVTPVGARGDFIAHLPALPAGGPHTLVVTVMETGERAEVHDLLVGEVWLASGQSNMEWTLAKSLPLSTDDIATADFPQIRFFTVSTRAHLGPQRTVDGNWDAASPATAGGFSAVAFGFARRLHRELGVPVGVISSAWGGSIIQSWLSRSALALNPHTAGWLARYESEVWTETRWNQMLNTDSDGRVNGVPADPGNLGFSRDWHLSSFDDSAWPLMRVPGTWQSAGHDHSGVYWFRRSVKLPPEWVGRELCVCFGAIDKQDITFVNGTEAGRTGKDREDTHWNQPRAYTIPASLVAGTKLVIAVRVYSFIYDGGIIGAAEGLHLHVAGKPEDRLLLAGDWHYQCEHDFGRVKEGHLMGHGERNSPHILFDNMLQPLIPYALRGALWYQGEGNTGDPEAYASLLRDLILDWRRHWGRLDLAFHLVQLPGFQAPGQHQDGSRWARLREAQSAALTLPHTGMAVTIDLGEAGDLHPKDKIPVGERLAQSALAITYDRVGPPCGPLFDGLSHEGSAIRCHFRHAGTGLVTIDGDAPRMFFIADESRLFHPADARIDGDSVVVSHADIPHPVAVRYSWADNPEGGNLTGPAGLPAGPFRSDRW